MDYLPDFSNSKIEIRNRIEGALREKRRKPSIYQYSIVLCFFLFTSVCTALYMRSILLIGEPMLNSDIDYYSLEKLLLSEQLESETVILLPNNLSLISASNIVIKKGNL